MMAGYCKHSIAIIADANGSAALCAMPVDSCFLIRKHELIILWAKLGSACAGRTWLTERVVELLHSYATRHRVHCTHLLNQTRCEGPGTCIGCDQSQ